MIRDEVLTAEEVEGKSNTELLSKHILELQKDKGNLTDRVKEFEAQIEREKNLNQCLSDHNEQLRELIEKMKNCRNCKNEKIEGACGHFTQVGWCKNWELAD